jgi:hypothetical protein
MHRNVVRVRNTVLLGVVPVLMMALLATSPGAGAVAHATATSPATANVSAAGRFLAPVELDGGELFVAPAEPGQRPEVSRVSAAAKIWANPAVEGAQEGPLGYGLVSIALRVHGVARVERLLAWVGFARHTAAYSCPAETGPVVKEPPLPSDGYIAVVIGAVDGAPAVTYTARSSVCESVHPASLTNANEVVSVPWSMVGGATGAALQVVASVPPCGTVAGIASGGSATSMTITIGATVPDVLSHCGPAQVVSETVNLGPLGNPPGAPPPLVSPTTRILHGALGPAHLTVTP